MVFRALSYNCEDLFAESFMSVETVIKIRRLRGK